MEFIWNSPSYPSLPEGQKERKNSSTTGRQPRMVFTKLPPLPLLNLSLLLTKPTGRQPIMEFTKLPPSTFLTKPIISNIVRMEILIVVMLRSLYELSGSQLKLERYRED